MSKKTIILNESQVKRLMENRINEVSAEEIANVLSSVECSGEDLKTLMERKMVEYGFEDVRIKFLGYTAEERDMMYLIYTEGPLFVAKARSEQGDGAPCLNIYDVQSYTK